MKLPLLLAVVLLAWPAAASQDALEEKFQGLKDAVSAKDAAQVKKLAIEVFPLVSAVIAEPAPTETSEKEVWANHIEHAKGVQTYAEYALFTIAVSSQPATLVDMVATLEQQNPKSQYLDTVYGRYLIALGQTGAAAKMPAIAEKALVNFPQNEDLLMWLADNAFTRKQPDRALTYANRAVAVMAKHPRPEGVPAAQWEQKRTVGLGRSYWIAGVVYGEKGNYLAADQNLRSALPLIQGNESMLAPALFHLGMSNYQLGKMTMNKARILEGAKFSDQCAAMDSGYADQARHNAQVMKNEAARMR